MGAMHWLGEALSPLRPGVDALKSSGLEPAVRMSVKVTSEAFTEGDGLPRWATADGEARFPGVSWDGLPAGTASVVLLVEDADIPFVRPVTHLIVHSIAPSLGGLEAGAIGARLRGPSAAGWACGRNFLGAPAGRRRRRRRVMGRTGMRSRCLRWAIGRCFRIRRVGRV